jgi:hypothetical protein
MTSYSADIKFCELNRCAQVGCYRIICWLAVVLSEFITVYISIVIFVFGAEVVGLLFASYGRAEMCCSADLGP